MVWSSRGEVLTAKHRAMGHCWCGVMLASSRILDQIGKEEIPIAELAKL